MNIAEELAKKHECLKDVQCGISIGWGWFTLVDKLTQILEIHEEVTGIPMPKIMQIKQKFKGLRYYIQEDLDSMPDLYIAGAINLAEVLSTFICEYCGAPSMNPGFGTGSTYCKDCKGKLYPPDSDKNE